MGQAWTEENLLTERGSRGGLAKRAEGFLSATLWDHSGEDLAVGGTSWAEEGLGAQVVSVESAGCELQPAGLQGACGQTSP